MKYLFKKLEDKKTNNCILVLRNQKVIGLFPNNRQGVLFLLNKYSSYTFFLLLKVNAANPKLKSGFAHLQTVT